jgi:hypothetical protein
MNRRCDLLDVQDVQQADQLMGVLEAESAQNESVAGKPVAAS